MRRFLMAAVVSAFSLAACFSRTDTGWSAFIACAFYGIGEACYNIPGEFPHAVAPVASVSQDASGQDDSGAGARITVAGLTDAMHTQFRAYEAARAAARAAGRPEPSPAMFVEILDAERPVGREQARVFLENALGEDWIHRIEPPATGRNTTLTEPL